MDFKTNINMLKNSFKDIESSLIEALTILNREQYQAIESRMDALVGKILQHDKNWLESKINEFLNSANTQTKENFSALLGEIRAYGELLDTFYGCSIISQGEGSDFVLKIDDWMVNIEINTPQASSNGKITEYKEENNNVNPGNKIAFISISSKAPFGYPTRSKDNIQYEAVSKFAAIKENKEDKQFTKENVSILWLDMNDPTLFGFDLADQCTPMMAFNGAISSGALWYAFYGQKGDLIYANYTEICRMCVIPMEFDGRFKKGSNIDFIIVDAFTKKYIFQNPYSEKETQKKLYKYFLNLSNIQLSNSYFDFDKFRLKHIIDDERDKNNQFLEIYNNEFEE